MIQTRIARRHDWAPGLVTLTLEHPLAEFEPGQWTNVALEVGGERVRRAYSLASPPGAPVELFVSRVAARILNIKTTRFSSTSCRRSVWPFSKMRVRLPLA